MKWIGRNLGLEIVILPMVCLIFLASQCAKGEDLKLANGGVLTNIKLVQLHSSGADFNVSGSRSIVGVKYEEMSVEDRERFQKQFRTEISEKQNKEAPVIKARPGASHYLLNKRRHDGKWIVLAVSEIKFVDGGPDFAHATFRADTRFGTMYGGEIDILTDGKKAQEFWKKYGGRHTPPVELTGQFLVTEAGDAFVAWE